MQFLPHEFPNASIEAFYLPPQVFHSRERRDRNSSKRALGQIRGKLQSFDAVIVQFEYSVFGINWWDICWRLEQVCSSDIPTIVTIHALFEPDIKGTFSYSFLGRMMTMRTFLGDLFVKKVMNRRILKILEKRSIDVIVHDESTKHYIEILAPKVRVHCRSLVYSFGDTPGDRPDSYKINEIAKLRNSCNFIIGLFGMIAPYKGFEIALRAMDHLPANFGVILLGDINVQEITIRPQLSDYRDQLLKMVARIESDKSAPGRARWLGPADDATFAAAIKAVDAIVLPYHETGLSASGPAALAISFRKQIIASDIAAFSGLSRAFPNQVSLFKQGDEKALADAVVALAQDSGIKDDSVVDKNSYLELYSNLLRRT